MVPTWKKASVKLNLQKVHIHHTGWNVQKNIVVVFWFPENDSTKAKRSVLLRLVVAFQRYEILLWFWKVWKKHSQIRIHYPPATPFLSSPASPLSQMDPFSPDMHLLQVLYKQLLRQQFRHQFLKILHNKQDRDFGEWIQEIKICGAWFCAILLCRQFLIITGRFHVYCVYAVCTEVVSTFQGVWCVREFLLCLDDF